MSKASEWASTLDRPDYTPRPDLVYRDRGPSIEPVAYADGVELAIGHMMFPSQEALRLARWILDTFGEEGSA